MRYVIFFSICILEGRARESLWSGKRGGNVETVRCGSSTRELVYSVSVYECSRLYAVQVISLGTYS